MRGRTIGTLARWADRDTLQPVLEQGLVDEASVVRGVSAFALAGGDSLTDSMRENLFAMAEDDDEARHAREGALLALQGDALGTADQQRLQAAMHAFNTRRRSDTVANP